MTERTSGGQLLQPIDPEDRVAIALLIAAYQPYHLDSATIVSILCTQTDIWLLWTEVFETVCRSYDADVGNLTDMTVAILETAEAAGGFEGGTWLEDHRSLLGWQARESWEDLFSNADPAQLYHAGRRDLNAFLARPNAAGGIDGKLYFLEPTASTEWPDVRVVTVEELIMLGDYFRSAAVWMQSQFGIKPEEVPPYLKQILTYTKERWEHWKDSLEALADGGDLTLRSSARRALDAMD